MGYRLVGLGAAALLLTGAVVWAVLALTDGPEAESRGADTPVLAGVEPDPDSLTLADGANWTLAVSPGQALQLVQDSGGSIVSDYTKPVTLNEAASFLVGPRSRWRTIVAGPVHEDTEAVTLETPRGRTATGVLVDAHGLRWFWAELPGAAAIASIEATDASGQILDELTLPTMSPPTPAHIPEGSKLEREMQAAVDEENADLPND